MPVIVYLDENASAGKAGLFASLAVNDSKRMKLYHSQFPCQEKTASTPTSRHRSRRRWHQA